MSSVQDPALPQDPCEDEGIEGAEAGAGLLTVWIYSFALWTLCSQLTVLRGGVLDDLLVASSLVALVLGAVVLGAFLVSRLYRKRLSDKKKPVAVAPWSDARDLRTSGGRERMVFSLLALIVVGLTLVAHRPDVDDGTYLNLAVSVVDDPSLPILTFDRKHFLEHDVRVRTASRMRSYEMLFAAYARWTGRPVIEAAHLLLPPLGALLCLFAYRFLLQLLLPRTWLAGLVGVVLFLLSDGVSHQSFGNFSFVRLQQGKGWLVSVLVPAVLAYAWCFARRPSRRRWLRLAAAQVAAVGLSSTALLVIPLVLVQGLVAALGSPKNWRDLKDRRRTGWILAAGLGSGAYVALCALIARLPVVTALGGSGAQLMASREVPPLRWLELVLGEDPWIQGFRLFVLIAAPFFVVGPARRLCVMFSGLTVLLLAVSWIPETLARYWVPPSLVWRLVWALPLPLAMALFVLLPVHHGSGVGRRGVPRALGTGLLVVLLTVLAYGILSGPTILSPAGGVSLKVPGLKVGEGYAVAAQVVEGLEPGTVVAAPTEVSSWLPTFHDGPFPTLTREFEGTRTRFGAQKDDRRKLQRWMDRPPPQQGFPEREFLDFLRRFHADAVVLGAAPSYDPFRRVLRRLGWGETALTGGSQLWTAPPEWLEGGALQGGGRR